jgi:hypothetical protein
MSKNKEWGTPLWKILHGLTESLGQQTVPMLATDEAHELVFLLRDLEKVMPCALCRSHYHSWRKDNPIDIFSHMRGVQLRDAVRKWLYDLHENVNRSRQVESGITLEMLPDMYRSVEIKKEWAEFFAKMKLSTEVGLVSQTLLTNFHRHLAVLRKLVGR